MPTRPARPSTRPTVSSSPPCSPCSRASTPAPHATPSPPTTVRSRRPWPPSAARSRQRPPPDTDPHPPTRADPQAPRRTRQEHHHDVRLTPARLVPARTPHGPHHRRALRRTPRDGLLPLLVGRDRCGQRRQGHPDGVVVARGG